MAVPTRTTPPRPTRHSTDSAPQADRPVNVGNLDRWLSLLGGGLLALSMVQRSLGTIMLLGGAGALLYRGWTGHCTLYQTMGLSTGAQEASSGSSRTVAGPNEPPLIVMAGS